MKQSVFTIKENREIAPGIMKMVLEGDGGEIRPGQFVQVLVPPKFLRRPISVCDWDESGKLTLIYKIVGEGTEIMSGMAAGEKLDLLTELGNGYGSVLIGDRPVLIGGGSGIPPLYYLAKELTRLGKTVTVVMGFNTENDIYLKEEFESLACKVLVSTMDGSCGIKGTVKDAFDGAVADDATYFFACGPEPMLRAVCESFTVDGQLSFESRMCCGFGACMGCSMETKGGYKRVCKEGPVFDKDEIM